MSCHLGNDTYFNDSLKLNVFQLGRHFIVQNNLNQLTPATWSKLYF